MKALVCSCKHVLDGCDGVVANKDLLVALSKLGVVFEHCFAEVLWEAATRSHEKI